MVLHFLQRYSLKLVFALSLLLGLQLPHFLNQYETRLDAHYLESKDQLKQYQVLADLFFDGSLDALVDKHKNSEVALFKAESRLIEKLINRFDFLSAQKNNLQGSWLQQFAFLLTQVNQPLFNETQQNYQANIVLNKEAIVVGLVAATFMTILVELLLIVLTLLVKKGGMYVYQKYNPHN